MTLDVFTRCQCIARHHSRRALPNLAKEPGSELLIQASLTGVPGTLGFASSGQQLLLCATTTTDFQAGVAILCLPACLCLMGEFEILQ